MTVPDIRVRSLNSAPIEPRGEYVLYWMTAFRRPKWNFALERAVELCAEMGRPLVVLEALRIGYPWASDRLHKFVIEGMRDNHAYFESTPVHYYPYVEPTAGAGSGLLASLASKSCAVVTDDYPSFFLPKMLKAAATRLEVRLEAVDSNGLLPIRSTERVFTRAHSFRRHLHKALPEHLPHTPQPDPVTALPADDAPTVDAAVLDKWPAAPRSFLEQPALSTFDIDHAVRPAEMRGGSVAAHERLRDFMATGFAEYGAGRNHPDDDASSGLSPWLHFGHLSTHEVFDEIIEDEGWSLSDLATKPTGQREGWWGMGSSAEAFLDELVTWREVGFNMCAHQADYHRYESLPEWAKKTLAVHATDERQYIYTDAQFEHAQTHDEIWNAAQRQLVETGRMHNYLRMLWGKKILEWSATPQDALATMIELNNKYAVDGRDPNSYSGIFWVLGRYDRAWGPERPVFGKIRYMSSDSTRKKLRIKRYLERFGAQSSLLE